jgi:hypothetical protein
MSPGAVSVGGDAPGDGVVVAGAQVGEELGVELVVVVDGGLGDRGGGLAQHCDDLAGPALVGGVQTANALGPDTTQMIDD